MTASPWSRPNTFSRRRVRPAVEALEGRFLPSTLTVLNAEDAGQGSLRAALVAAGKHPGADAVADAPGLGGKTITPIWGEPRLDSPVTIAGPGAGRLTISRNSHSRVREVPAGLSARLAGLTIAQGFDKTGGGGDILNLGTPTVTPPAPAVQSMVLNDGSAQRSKIDSITVTFSGVVVLDEGAFRLTNGSGVSEALAVDAAVVNGHTVAVVRFTGADVVGGSLPDGAYRLTVAAASVHDASGKALDQDGTASFVRLFGDADGNGVVDNRDLAVFNTALRGRVGMANSLWYLDYDGNGVIDSGDYVQFQRRYGGRD